MVNTVNIGTLKIGPKYPVRIKGMLKTSISKREALLEEANTLVKEGAEAIRVAIKYPHESQILKYLKSKIRVPFVADIHFNYKLAIEAIECGFDGIRLNPLNITKEPQIKEVVKFAKKNGVHIRVGVNSGGFRQRLDEKNLAKNMVNSALNFIKILEKEDFFNISVSLKASNIQTTILANRLFALRSKYPLHLGITATGPFLEGVIKSSLGIGILLEEGIGNILRVSLTGPSFWEIKIAKFILQFLGLRYFEPEIVSCPTCSRCSVDLVKIVEDFYKKLDELKSSSIKLPKKIAIMGCEVNGPGEAIFADIGIAFGNKRGVIFKKNKILCSDTVDNLAKKFIKILEEDNGYKRN
ncbi:MAG: (E)-4-hydroxy-3-methylbut-2-enyl-diphosphate synthase [Candidatus Omnitrophica bacterium]|nr:(E)-4-hydroxy-3-methylbut-2-enyl-diphosphate synthase [Candidatus Omnitrophota bacterium]